MQLIEFDKTDPDLIDQAYAVLTAAHAADTPENPVMAERFFKTMFTHLFPGRVKRWFAAVSGGRLVGFARTTYFTDANLQLAMFAVHVHPDHRDRGVEAALIEHVETTAANDGRTVLTMFAPIFWEGGPARDGAAAAFLEQRGYSRALTLVNRRSKVDGIDPDEEARLYEKALAAAGDDYELRTWVGPTPEDLLASICRIESTINDEIPSGELEIEAESVDTEQKRAAEAVNAEEGRVNVQAVAVHRASGEVVAWTELGVDEGPYTAARQAITIVDPAHRGHRLGLLVKLANLRQLRERFPHIESVWTDNADVNEHMIAINETMRYETVDAIAEYQRKLES